MKNLTLRCISLFLFAGCFLIGCTHYHYVPSQQNVPGFKEKGEYKFSGGQSNGNDYTGFDAQIAYAPAKHIGLMANGFYAGGAKNGEKNNKGYGLLAEVGAGVWWPLAHDLVVEGYGGFGLAYLKNTKPSGPLQEPGVREYDFQRGFGQVSLTRRLQMMEYGVSARISGLYYSNLRINGDVVPGVTDLGWYYVGEPYVFIGGGGQRLKCILSLSKSYLLTPAELQLENYNFNLSVQYRIGGKINQYKKEKVILED